MSIGTAGLLSVNHLLILSVQRDAGVEFATVEFDGGGPTLTALLGGHADSAVLNVPGFTQYARDGQIRVLGLAGKNKFLPDAPVLSSLRYKVDAAETSHITVVRAGIPKGVVDVLRAVQKKVVANDDMQKTWTKGDMDLPDHFQEQSALVTYYSWLEWLAAIPSHTNWSAKASRVRPNRRWRTSRAPSKLPAHQWLMS